jgi:phospholipid/cholesterol/gamma-HCH transport system ATP-binding protein
MYDEPFAGLDPIALGVTAHLIKDMNLALGATSILVTHDVPETFAIADYVYFIADGKIAAHGTPMELKESPDPFATVYSCTTGWPSYHFIIQACRSSRFWN